MKLTIALAALAAVTSGAAFAQDSAAPSQGAPAAASAAPACELHLWPAERMTATTTGWLSGFAGGLGALVEASSNAGQNAGHRSQLASALDSPSQLSALQSMDLVQLLSLPAGTVVVPHETPLVRNTMNSVKIRRSDSTAGCYYELITADVAYRKAAIYGRSLRTLFMLREFGDDQRIDFEYKSWGGNGLSHFPPAEGEDVTVAMTELNDVFRRNFEEYANNERQAMARHRNRNRSRNR
jgi:hypothetical protein